MLRAAYPPDRRRSHVRCRPDLLRHPLGYQRFKLQTLQDLDSIATPDPHHSVIYSAAGGATSTYGGSAANGSTTTTHGGSANNSAASDDCAATTVVGASTAILIVRVTIATAVIRAAHNCRAASDGPSPHYRSTAIRCPTASRHGAPASRHGAPASRHSAPASRHGAPASCPRREGVSRKTHDPKCGDRNKRNNSTI